MSLKSIYFAITGLPEVQVNRSRDEIIRHYTCLGILLSVMGLVLLFPFLQSLPNAVQGWKHLTSNYTRTTGKVERGDAFSERMGKMPGVRVDVTYSYKVGGRPYTKQERFYARYLALLGPNADYLMEKYEPGAIIEVGYLASDPEKAFLEPSVARSDIASSTGSFLLVTTLLVLGLWFFKESWRVRHSPVP